jgi:hypothetical protein
MADRYRTAGGWSVEVIERSGTPDNTDGQQLRVRYHGFYVADVRTVAELEQWFPLADLEPDGLSAAVTMGPAGRLPAADRGDHHCRSSRPVAAIPEVPVLTATGTKPPGQLIVAAALHASAAGNSGSG